MLKKLLLSTTFITAALALLWAVWSPELCVQTPSSKFPERVEKEKPDRPGEAAAFWAERLKTPHGENPAALNMTVKRRIEHLRAAKAMSDPTALRFEDFGPGNFGGRVRSIVVHSANPDVILTGGVSGGVFKTVDGGRSWSAKNDFLPNLAIGCMIGDPDQPNRVFAGTGEGFFNGDYMLGYGIFVSEDFGETWIQLPSTTEGEFSLVNRLGRIPNSDILLAATYSGIFRSPDLGATWSEVSGVIPTGRGFVDLKVDPSNPQKIYAYHYGSGGDGQMTVTLTVTAPSQLAGSYAAAPASFGPALADVGPISAGAAVFQGDTTGTLACDAATNADQIQGRIALVDRGECEFAVKVRHAQQAGASAVIVVNNVNGPPTQLGGDAQDITIPAVMVSEFDGELFKDFSEELQVTLEGSLDLSRYLMRSADGGLSFEKLDSRHGLPITDISRMEIGVGTDGVVYLAVADNSSNPATRGLWRSTDGGQSFSKTASNAQFIERQGWYDLMVGVTPGNSDKVFLGAIDVSITENGGQTISQVTTWAPQAGQLPYYIHADIHAIAFHPHDPDTVWIGTDGGIFKTTDGGNRFQSLNANLRIAQNYGLAVHPDGETVITGTQDNGSHLFFGDRSTWLEWWGGDGGFCAWDQQQPDHIYGANPYGQLFGSADGGSSVQIMRQSDDNGLFIAPFTLDPNDGNRMILGTNRVWFTQNARDLDQATWNGSSSLGSAISALAFDPHHGSRVWAGTRAGRLFMDSDVNQGLDFAGMSAFPSGSPISWIALDPLDASGQTIYVTRSQYDTDRIWRSTDGGETFSSIHGNLPEIPVHCLVVDPIMGQRVFVGTELGLWVTEDQWAEPVIWRVYDYGVAWTRVVQMMWASPDALWIATHGRGTYRATRHPLVLNVQHAPLQGDGDAFLDWKETHHILVQVENPTSLPLEPVNVTLQHDQGDAISLDPTSQTLELGPGESQELAFRARLDTLNAPLTQATFTATAHLGSSTITATHDLLLGGNPSASSAFFDGAESPDTLVRESLVGHEQFTRVTNQVHSGSHAWFSPDVPYYSDHALITPVLDVVDSQARLDAWIYYDMEGNASQYWDGAVMEIRRQDGDWLDLGRDATGAIYDGQLFQNNTLYMRHAWSGRQKTWRQVSVDLGTYEGESVQIRFRVGCDTAASATQGGFWLDDLHITGVQTHVTAEADAQPCDDCNNERGSQLAYRYHLAHTPGDLTRRGFVGVVNPNQQAVEVEIFGFSDLGVEQGRIPGVLAAQGKIYQPVTEWFGESSQVSWVQVGCDAPLVVFATVKTPTSESAYLASEGLNERLFVPHVAQNTALFETLIAAVNGSNESIPAQVTPGTDQPTSVPLGTPLAPFNRAAETAAQLFGDGIENISWAILEGDTPSMAAMEGFTVLPARDQSAMLGLTPQSGNTLRFLHIAADTNLFWTGLVYFNPGNAPVNVQEFSYDTSGALLGTRDVTLDGFQKQTLLLDHSTSGSGPIPEGTAWMEVLADGNLVGYELFGASFQTPHRFFAGLQGSYTHGRALVFPHVDASQSTWTGLVVLNLADGPENINFTLLGAEGMIVAQTTVQEVPGRGKRALLVSDLFAEEDLNQAAWVRAEGDHDAWTGFVLWGDQEGQIRENMSGIQAIPWP